MDMNELELRKSLLGSKKTERVIFAVTPEFKSALESLAKERCVSVSALITQALLEELSQSKEIFNERDCDV